MFLRQRLLCGVAYLALCGLFIHQSVMADSFQKGVEILQQQLKEGKHNIVIAPHLITSTQELNLQIAAAIKPDARYNLPVSMDSLSMGTSSGLHLISKREYIDDALASSSLPMTTSHHLNTIGYDQIVENLDARIEKDTNGFIKGFLDVESLSNPNLAYKLVTWFYQKVKWVFGFESSTYKRSWDQQSNHPPVDWMETNDQPMKTNHEGTSWTVQIPTKDKDVDVVVMHDTDNNILDTPPEKMVKLLKSYDAEEEDAFTLVMPKYKFEYQFTEDSVNDVDSDSATHKAAIKVDEEGAEVAAASSMDCCDGISETITSLTLDKPFLFAMIDRSTGNKELVCLAYVYEPWEKTEE